MGGFLFKIQNGMQDGIGGQVPVVHFRKSIVAVAACSGGKTNQLQSGLFCPAGNTIVIPLVWWKKIPGIMRRDIPFLHLRIGVMKILIKLPAGYEKTIPVRPAAVEQMFIGMCAQVVTLML